MSSLPAGLFLPRGLPAHILGQADFHPHCQLAFFGTVHPSTTVPRTYPTVPVQEESTVPVQAESESRDYNRDSHEGETEATTGQDLNSSTGPVE